MSAVGIPRLQAGEDVKAAFLAGLALCVFPSAAPAGDLLWINRDAYDLSAATGGDFYFWAPGEFASSGVRIPLGQDAVLLSNGELSGGIEMAHGGGTDLKEFRHMTIASVDAPEPGEWCLEAEGKGLHAFSARVASAPPGKGGERPVPISVVGADFIDPKGYLGREGYIPKKVKPRAGKTMQFSVRMNGPFDTVSFELVAPDGTVLIRPNPIAVDGDELIGECIVPKTPFRISVRGRDRSGREYARVFSPLMTP
ncbi:MAG TPA: hypothetical protein VJ386_10335 [Candidatus Deferrimicrobiaceae bacterium]|nr:hypothetical protein [Candidatus Deferrimicrobiaceae bacterium]